MKIGRVVFELCERTDKQTDRQTYTLTIILRTPVGGEVTRDALFRARLVASDVKRSHAHWLFIKNAPSTGRA